MSRGRSRALALLAAAAAVAAGATAPAAAADAPAAAPSVAPGPGVIIHRTEYGVPHIVADDERRLGYGYGYAVARDNLCLLAESYVTVAGERSKFFGPDGTFVFHANGATHANLDSDFFHRQILAEGFETSGLRPAVRQLIAGYVEGYNRVVEDTSPDGVGDPACRGEPWVRPITEELAYARFTQLAALAGGGLAITGIASAQPPPPSTGGAERRPDRSGMLAELGRRLELGGLGSNAVALGRDATRSGGGMVLGNPHLPWKGDYRLYHAHLTIPGKLDAAGATFIGVPLVLIGHTRDLAWTHTTSSAFRFTPVELRLVPGRPTTYLVDGEPRDMTSRIIEVEVRRPDGALATVSRRLWSTEYGPVLTELLGLPLFPWTPTTAHAFADANARNLRYLEHFHDTNRAGSVGQLARILRRHLGIPWANTIAADRRGRTLYADASVVPHVTDEHAARCNTVLGVAAFAQLRLPVLDGSRSSCRWGRDADAPVPGIFGPGRLPFLRRDDYVINSNDSHWLANPAAPLEGYARIIGDERSERSLRTRLALRMVAEGTPEGFTLDALRAMQFNDRDGAAELMRDDLVALCRSLPALPSTRAGAVPKGDACEVLARWDGRDALDSRGALLFRRWKERALPPRVPGANAVGGGPPQAGTWSDAFDPDRPVETPRRLNTANPVIQTALGDAVADLRDAGIALDAPLGDHQTARIGDEVVPMHGGPGRLGVFNAMNVTWVPGRGYPDIPHGATYLMATELRGRCPRTHALTAYSQSSDPTSAHATDQTWLYSRGAWPRERFCAREVLASPALRVRRLGCLPRTAGGRGSIAWLRPGLAATRLRRIAGPPDRRRAAHGASWCVSGGGWVGVALAGAPARVALVATTSGARRVAGARPGARAPRAGWRRLAPRLLARRSGRYVALAATRRGRAVWVGLARARAVRSPGRLRSLARRAGMRVSG